MSSIQRIERKSGLRYKAVLKQGQTVLKTKTFTKRTHANQWLARMQADREAVEALGLRGAQMTFDELADHYLAAWSGKDTSRPGQVAFWRERLARRYLTDIDTEMVRQILENYAQGKAQRPRGSRDGSDIVTLARSRAPATVNRMRAAVSAVFQFAQQSGWINHNPVKAIPQRAEDNARHRYLNEAEIARLLEAARECAWERMNVLVLMAITTGARKSELLKLQWRHINLEKRNALLPTSKNGEPRVLTLTQDVVKTLRPFRGIGLVFPSPSKPWQPIEIKKYWQQTLKLGGFPLDSAHHDYFRFHDLRHTAASHLAMNGATLFEVGEVLGHRSVATTKRYAHLSIAHKQALTDRVFSNLPGE